MLSWSRYLAALPYARAFGGCSVKGLRFFNVACLFLIYFVLSTPGQGTSSGRRSRLGLPTLSAVNAILFPPLFFFSALFYTDVISTLSVLLFLEAHNARVATWASKGWSMGIDLLRVVLLVVLGVFCLLCRQTNIFWVGIFPAIDAAFRGLGRPGKSALSHGTPSFTDIIQHSWESRDVYDPLAQPSSISGMSRVPPVNLSNLLRRLLQSNPFSRSCRSSKTNGLALGRGPQRNSTRTIRRVHLHQWRGCAW